MANSIQSLINARKNKIQYSDLRKDLATNPVTEDLALYTEEESIKESIKNLLLTDKGERRMQPNLGGNIRATLFENNTPATVTILREQIKEVLKNHEPRISVIQVAINSKYDENKIEVSISFYIQSKETPVSTTIFLERIR